MKEFQKTSRSWYVGHVMKHMQDLEQYGLQTARQYNSDQIVTQKYTCRPG